MPENSEIQFEKQNKCNAKLRCTASSPMQQRECTHFVKSGSDQKTGNCLLHSHFRRRCCSPEANSEALDRLINAVKEQL
jgi:hypothetical protein